MSTRDAGKPTVLFVCVHNAGRSQMAAGWLTHLAGDRIEVRSAGSQPAGQLNLVAVQAMREVGIDTGARRPTVLRNVAAELPSGQVSRHRQRRVAARHAGHCHPGYLDGYLMSS